jgi:dihydrofolate reductase
MRELIYYVAATLDGFIAETDGSFDKFPWDPAYGADLAATFPETLPTHARQGAEIDPQLFEIVLMGRNTYEVGAKEGFTNPYAPLRQYVFSRSMEASPDANVTLVSDDAVAAVRELKQESGKAIWLCGGGELAGTLFKADLIDRLIVKLNPVIFGTGIPLFASIAKHAALDLTDHKVYPSGHVVLHYRVKR